MGKVSVMQRLALALLGLILGSMALGVAPTQAAEYNPAAPFISLAEDNDFAAVMDPSGLLYVVSMNNRGFLVETTYSQGKVVSQRNLSFRASGYYDTESFLSLAYSDGKLHLLFASSPQLCYTSRTLANPDWAAADCGLSDPQGAPVSQVHISALPDSRLGFAWQVLHEQKLAVREANGKITMLPLPGDPNFGRGGAVLLGAGSQGLTVLWVQERQPGPGGSIRSEILGSEWQGSAWGTPVSISGFTNDPNAQWAAGSITAITTPDGTIHLAYVLFAPGPDYSGMPYRLYYKRGKLGSLSSEEMVSARTSWPILAVNGDRVELAWSSPTGTTIGLFRIENNEIFWSRKGTGGWSNPVNISYTAGSSGKPALFIGPDGESYAVWSDCNGMSCGSEVLLAHTEAKGQAWGHRAEPDGWALKVYTNRADWPVDNGYTVRSWLWGPKNWLATSEIYAESPEAKRNVFYFDKARIEVNDPNQLSSNQYYFSGGLLVTEMVTGRVQYGNYYYLGDQAAEIPVAGDPLQNPNAPLYGSFRKLVYIPEGGQGEKYTDQTGVVVNQCINPAGEVSPCNPATRTVYSAYISETGRNIAEPFWRYLNQNGLVYQNGQLKQGQVFDWIATMGYPMTQPYWTKARVGGVEKDVLVQLFQRRTLTYTPSNQPGFQVEMGNVGQHYYMWRYGLGDIPWLK